MFMMVDFARFWGLLLLELIRWGFRLWLMQRDETLIVLTNRLIDETINLNIIVIIIIIRIIFRFRLLINNIRLLVFTFTCYLILLFFSLIFYLFSYLSAYYKNTT
jgi:hypothetical protein